MGILLPRKAKKTKKSKKDEPTSLAKKAKSSISSKSTKQMSETVAMAVEATIVITPVVEESQEDVVIPSKIGMFRRIKMKSKHKRKSSSMKLLHKPQLSFQGVMFREVPVPVSPASKKRAAEDMAKHLSQLTKKKTKKSRKIVLSNESTEEDERVPETPETTILTSSIPETTVIFTPEVSIANSLVEEVRTSGLGENVSKDAAQGSVIYTPFETFISVPPTSTIHSTSTTIYVTFEHILNHPITSMFSSQSTETPKPTSPTETDHEGFGGTFEDLEFQDEEQDFPDHMLMMMKQYKILNKKLNSIIQSQADLGGGSSISSLEVDSMLKMCESRIIAKVLGMLKASEIVLMEKIDYSDENTELHLKNQRNDFLGEVKDLRSIAKERHVLFVHEVKKVREDVNLKIQEPHEQMNREIIYLFNMIMRPYIRRSGEAVESAEGDIYKTNFISIDYS
ncbi:unnamed protein product [Lactuca saligna]|uniref:Uncharacterized protein n=1 Tax=Lactuca saligna TaxID=75948 RepID=A0AA35Y696_LACSI|nr:unnamed protein product [Lactuca saligna]